MTVIDVDTHWEIGALPPSEHPLGPWLDRLQIDGVERLAHGIAGDLLRALPEDRRPSGRELLPGLVRLAEQRGGPIILHPQHDSTAAERVAWMDRVGIDHCLVNPGSYWQLLDFLGDERPLGVARCNDFLGDMLSDHADRLHGVAVVDLSDLSTVPAQLRHARDAGTARSSSTPTMGSRPRRPPPAIRTGTWCGPRRSIWG